MKATVTTAFNGLDNDGTPSFFPKGTEITDALAVDAVAQGLAEWTEAPSKGASPKATGQVLQPYVPLA